ncbi:MAG: helix-turn-helix domain-containing protein [Luteibaculum sp.]
MEHLFPIIAEGEHEQQDFKLRIDESRKIAITLSAFANRSGGRLLIGVKDNGKVAGVKSVEEEFHMVKAAAEMYCKPTVTIEPQVFNHEGKDVLIVEVKKSDQPPVLAKNTEGKWRAYLRMKDENMLMNSVLSKSFALTKNKQDLVQLNPKVLGFLQYAKEKDFFGFQVARRKMGLNAMETEQTLALLIRWKVIDFAFSSKGVLYTINPEQTEIDISH